MAKYRITAPDGGTYEVTAPDDATQEQVLAYAKENYKPAAKKDNSSMAQNFAGGLLKGASQIGATLLAPVDYAARKMGVSNDFIGRTDRRAQVDDFMQSNGVDTDSFAYGGGKIGAEIAGTAGVGGAIANGLRVVPLVAKTAAPLIDAIGTSGMTAQGAGMGTRMLGGAIAGGAAAGMVDPNDAATGAVIGGAFPPVLKAAGYAGSAVGRGVKKAFTPESRLMAGKVADMSGLTREEALSALSAQGPSMTGIRNTVPQILQSPQLSQLQRTVINAGGGDPILAREAAQNTDRIATIGMVSPIAGSVNESADKAGSLISGYANPVRVSAGKNVNALFDAVDPFGETAFQLPIQQMEQAQAKYLGLGTFGTGSKAAQAIETAKQIGTEELPAVGLTKAGKQESLLDFVKRSGGINANSISSKAFNGEVADLRQAGLGRVVYKNQGMPLGRMAEKVREAGFTASEDPAELLDLLRNSGKDTFRASADMDSTFRRAAESAMGDAPIAERIPKNIPFSQVQNLRSSLSEAWKDASAKGRNKEAAALNEMIDQIDGRVKAVANGNGNPGEYFPADIVKSWRDALDAHAAKKLRFDTGPQARMFRQGGDGQAAIQGAEIPREFFNPRASQVEDAQAFKRLVGDNKYLVDALKGYATTDAANQTTKDGMLSYSKLANWMKSRDGAIKETFTPQERAILGEVLKDVQRADIASSGWMAKGSNTAQNISAAERAIGSGLLDSPIANVLANKIPVVNQLTGPLLQALRDKAMKGKAEKLGGLLADPDLLTVELAKLLASQQPGAISRAAPAIQQFGYRAAPLLGSGQ